MPKKDIKLSLMVSIPLMIITTTLVIYILWIGGSLIIPFIVALLLSFAIIGLMNFYKKFKIPGFISFLFSIVTYGFIFWLFGKLVGSNIDELVKELPAYQIKITNIFNGYYDLFSGYLERISGKDEVLETLSGATQNVSNVENTGFVEIVKNSSGSIVSGPFKIPEPVTSFTGSITSTVSAPVSQQTNGLQEFYKVFDLRVILESIVGGITSIFSKAGIIIFYVIFILLEYRYFGQKLKIMIKDDYNRHKVIQVIEKIRNDVKSYFVIKTFVSLSTGLLSYIIMTIFGLDFAIFWAFLIFALNFIPSIGSIIAVTFPILFSLVQFDNYQLLLFNSFYIEGYYIVAIMASGLIGIQVLMGNIIEPKFVGNKLNLSPLVIILALGFWGSIWGIVGMLLSVPIMVIINIILAKIPETRSIAVLLSEKGELEIEPEDEVRESRRQLLEKVKKRLKRERKKAKKKKS